MIKLGMVIGDRYEMLEKIGTGGMSDVYKAKDRKLNRFVAVKILKQEFSENRNFVSKFRVEAQAAAGLMHPNIVNVYDVGEDDTIHYIVMELVEGITLKKYIEKKVRLSTKEAISIAIQVAMGIEAAHNNHIIHRDIKPQNIIISKEGKVKVTDFGIAKAASSNTITSNVMGSVHYTSPEQARGGFSDEKSDIYSMGITLFEMITGRVPFNGDTTVSVAIKHIQDPMPTPREFVPEIPVSVENIIMKCTQKNPDRRYQNMGDMIRDLKHSLINPDDAIAQVDTADEVGQTQVMVPEQQTPPMPAVLETVWEDRVPRRESYAEEEDLQAIPNQVKPAKRRADGNTASQDYYEEPYEEAYRDTYREGKRSSGGGAKKNASNTKNTGKNAGSKKAANKKAANKNSAKRNREYEYYEDTGVNRQNIRNSDYEEERSYYNDEYDYNPKAEGIRTVFTIIAAVVIGCILLYFVGQATGLFEQIDSSINGDTNTEEEVKRAVMPEFAGKDAGEVQKALNEAGLGYKTTYVESNEYDKNIVISAALEDGQTVLARDKILLNTTIVLTVSAGADGINVPPVVGLSEAEGTATLVAEGFTVNKQEGFSTEYAKGTIVSQSPEGNSLAAIASEITIVISMGGESVEIPMPNVLGNSEEAAISVLEAAGLTVGEIEESYSAEYPAGQVCYQSYEAGVTVNQDAVVDLKISIGVETATYNCNLAIQAPEDYVGGNAEVILTTADGTTRLWYSNTVTSFPVAINLSGFSSSSAYGIVTITYVKNVPQSVTDADGNVTTQMVQEVAQKQENVQFTKN
ncbi:MAG: Stk1 family PASTA domain-containing Ser/Thr kinase [Roseburia sp.]|nr:Stk1 family PASTA domain-containing Ser/Thr kinase [Roseburia sp.]